GRERAGRTPRRSDALAQHDRGPAAAALAVQIQRIEEDLRAAVPSPGWPILDGRRARGQVVKPPKTTQSTDPPQPGCRTLPAHARQATPRSETPPAALRAREGRRRGVAHAGRDPSATAARCF